MYFSTNLRFLRNKLGLTQSDLGNQLSINRSTLNNYENKLAEPPFELMMRFADYFGIALDSFLRVNLETASPSQLKSILEGSDAFVKGRKLRVVATTVGADNIDNIELVEAKAQAGYLSGFADPEFIEQLPVFRLPFLSPQKKYRTFQIVGDSMLPIPSGSWITAEYLDDWTTIKSGDAAVILTVDDGLTFKIVENHIEKKGLLQLISLNPLYKPYWIKVSSVREIWRFTLYISPYLPSGEIGNEQIYREIQDVRMEVQEIRRVIGDPNN